MYRISLAMISHAKKEDILVNKLRVLPSSNMLPEIHVIARMGLAWGVSKSRWHSLFRGLVETQIVDGAVHDVIKLM